MTERVRSSCRDRGDRIAANDLNDRGSGLGFYKEISLRLLLLCSLVWSLTRPWLQFSIELPDPLASWLPILPVLGFAHFSTTPARLIPGCHTNNTRIRKIEKYFIFTRESRAVARLMTLFWDRSLIKQLCICYFHPFYLWSNKRLNFILFRSVIKSIITM